MYLVHLWNGGKASTRLSILYVVLQTAKHQHAHPHQHEQQAKVLPAGPDRVGDGLEANRPPGQFEDPHDPRNSEDLHDPSHISEPGLFLDFLKQFNRLNVSLNILNFLTSFSGITVE